MNFRLLRLIPVFSSVFSVSLCSRLSSQRDKSLPDWKEALTDFKSLVHVISFGEEIPSHHSNPLQILLQSSSSDSKKNPFELPGGWFGKRRNGNAKKSFVKPQKKFKKRRSSDLKKEMAKLMNTSQLRNEQSQDDLVLLNFLNQLEEPNTRASVQNPKNLKSLLMSENRYNEIKNKLGQSQRLSKKSKFEKIFMKKPVFKAGTEFNIAKQAVKPKDENKKKNEGANKKWYERLDAKGARNTLTLSVAFGVILTALFCVIIQLFKLFSSPKSNVNAFEQINRRSTYGYDRIALDVEEDEETAN